MIVFPEVIEIKYKENFHQWGIKKFQGGFILCQ